MLTGKVAFVTGASRGIGAAIAKKLSSAGAATVITHRHSPEAASAVVDDITHAGGSAFAVRADSRSPAEVEAAIDQTVARFGSLDIMVNNAAIQGSGHIESYPIDLLDQMIEVNIRSVFLAIQEAIRHMPNGSPIINIGSVSSDYMPYAGHAVYAMTKGAVSSLTRGLARDLGPRRITVNNVQPGRIDTEMLRKALGDCAAKAKAAIPMRKFGEVEDVAGLVAFLAGPDASYITGASLRVDGGVSL